MSISNQTAGFVGLSLSLGLLILAVWRACHHFSSHDFNMTWRRTFHALFILAMLVESMSYVELSGIASAIPDEELTQSVGYILLEVVGRSLLEVLTFSVVTGLWLETVGKSIGPVGKNLLLGGSCILVSVSFVQALDMIRSPATLWIYQLDRIVEASCWSLHCLAALACCIFTTNRIITLSTFPQFDRINKTKILLKALMPMLVCAICYGNRAVWLVRYELEGMTPTAKRSSLYWWIGFTWMPTLIPSVMLLYSTRKRDIVSDDGADEPLLSPPGPPMNAFVSFRLLENDVLSVSSFFQTPMRREDEAAGDASLHENLDSVARNIASEFVAEVDEEDGEA